MLESIKEVYGSKCEHNYAWTSYFCNQISHAPFFAFYGKLSPKMCAALSVSIVIMRLICLRFFMQVLY